VDPALLQQGSQLDIRDFQAVEWTHYPLTALSGFLKDRLLRRLSYE